VGEQNVSSGQQDGIADFAPAGVVDIGPGDVPFSDDEHVMLLLFAGVEEVVLGQPFAG
jgi:hypothetical protein